MESAFKTKILIVDDKPANLTALEAVLDSPRYALIRASSGLQALELARRHDFAAIIMDLNMPILDGYETARRIKRLPGGAEIPIVFVTAVYTDDEDVRRGYEVGAIDFLSKPFDPRLLRTKVAIYTDLYLTTRLLAAEERILSGLEKSRRVEVRLEAVLETAPIGIVSVDGGTGLVELNREARRIWGATEGSLPFERYARRAGRRPGAREALRPEEWPLARALARGESGGEELVEIEAFDGQRRLVAESAAPLRGPSGVIVGATSSLRELARAEPRSANRGKPQLRT